MSVGSENTEQTRIEKERRQFNSLNILDMMFMNVLMSFIQAIDPEEPAAEPFNGIFATILGMNDTEYRSWHAENSLNDWSDWQNNTDFDRVNYGAARDVVNNPPEGLLGLIAEHESNGNYNIAYNNVAVNFTGMTINEVQQWQRNYINSGSPSSAAGRYQIISGTLQSLKDELGLTGDELFDEAMQDRMAIALLERRGLDDFLEGRMSEAQFMRRLSQEWASLPRDMGGRSYYAGDGLNRALTSPESVLAAIRQTQDEYHERRMQGLDSDAAMVAATTSVARDEADAGIASNGLTTQTQFASAVDPQRTGETVTQDHTHTPSAPTYS